MSVVASPPCRCSCSCAACCCRRCACCWRGAPRPGGSARPTPAWYGGCGTVWHSVVCHDILMPSVVWGVFISPAESQNVVTKHQNYTSFTANSDACLCQVRSAVGRGSAMEVEPQGYQVAPRLPPFKVPSVTSSPRALTFPNSTMLGKHPPSTFPPPSLNPP